MAIIDKSIETLIKEMQDVQSRLQTIDTTLNTGIKVKTRKYVRKTPEEKKQDVNQKQEKEEKNLPIKYESKTEEKQLQKQEEIVETQREFNDTQISIRDQLNEHSQVFMNGFGRIDSHFSEVTQPFKDVFGLFKGGFDMIKGGLNHFSILPSIFNKDDEQDDEQLEEQKQQTGLLRDLLNWFHKEDLEDKRKFEDKGGGFLGNLAGLFGQAIFGLGFIIGGIVSYIVMPFKLLIAGLRELGLLTKFKNWITSLRTFLMSFSWISNTLNKLRNAVNIALRPLRMAVSWVSRIFAPVTKVAKWFANHFASGFASGFKYLGWPLTIIMGLIDFIQGFRKTQGDILEKIKGGLSNALIKFLDILIMPIGWLTDKVLGFFNVELEGGFANKIRSGIESFISGFVGFFINPIENVVNVIKEYKDKLVHGNYNTTLDIIFEIVKNIPSFIFDTVKGIVSGVVSPFVDQIRDIKNFVMDKSSISIDNLKSIFSLFVEETINLKNNIISTGLTIIDNLKNLLLGFGDWIKDNTLLGRIYTGIKNLLTTSNTEETLISKLKNMLSKIGSWIEKNTLLGRLYTGIKNFLSKPEDKEKSIFDLFVEQYNKLKEWFKNSWIGKAVSGIKNFLIGKDEDIEKTSVNSDVKKAKSSLSIEDQITQLEQKLTNLKSLSPRDSGRIQIPKVEQKLDRLKQQQVTQTPMISNGSSNISAIETQIKDFRNFKELERLNESQKANQSIDNSLRKYHEDIKRMNITNNTNNNYVQQNQEPYIPDEPESLSLLLFNKNWGIS